MSKLLVVGGAGYIGSHFVLHALEEGYEIVVIDDLLHGSREAILGGTFYQGNIANRDLLRQIFSEHKIEAVFHFAAYIEVEESVRNPYKYYENNVSNTLILVDEVIKAGIEYFVFSSTAATYGEPQYSPVDLFHPQKPLNPYGMSKLMVENILKDFSKAYSLKTAILRYFNAAGADPEGRIGFHEPATHLIPTLLKAANARMPYVKIFGTNYDTPDGTCIRDYIHVMDLASAHLLVLKKMKNSQQSLIYNLGNGVGYSVKEVINAVKRITGKQLIIVEAGRRPGDSMTLIADSAFAKEELLWVPQYFELEKIVKDAYRWELNPCWHRSVDTNL